MRSSACSPPASPLAIVMLGAPPELDSLPAFNVVRMCAAARASIVGQNRARLVFSTQLHDVSVIHADPQSMAVWSTAMACSANAGAMYCDHRIRVQKSPGRNNAKILLGVAVEDGACAGVELATPMPWRTARNRVLEQALNLPGAVILNPAALGSVVDQIRREDFLVRARAAGLDPKRRLCLTRLANHAWSIEQGPTRMSWKGRLPPELSASRSAALGGALRRALLPNGTAAKDIPQ